MFKFASPFKRSITTPQQPTSDFRLIQYIKYLIIYSIQSIALARAKSEPGTCHPGTQHSANPKIWFGLNIPLNEKLFKYFNSSLSPIVEQMVASPLPNSLHIEVIARPNVLLERLTFTYEKKMSKNISQTHIYFQFSSLIKMIISCLRVSTVYYKFFRAIPKSGDFAFFRLMLTDSVDVGNDTFTRKLIGTVVDSEHSLSVYYEFRNDSYNFSNLVDMAKISCEEYGRERREKCAKMVNKRNRDRYFGEMKFANLARFRDEMCRIGENLVGPSLGVPELTFLEKDLNDLHRGEYSGDRYLEAHFSLVSDLFDVFFPISLRTPRVDERLSSRTVAPIRQTMEDMKNYAKQFEQSESQFFMSD